MTAVRSGTRVGHYEIGPLLGAGGMGEVYRARDLTLHRDVALKIVPPDQAKDDGTLARFEREARLLASLNHPQIASIYGVFESDGVRAIVMELVEGETLAERLARGPLPLQEALSTAAQIAEAIDVAHEKGVIHRDLKPANIKFTSTGSIKILDFGIAKALAPEVSAVSMATTVESTRAGTIIGTAGYMAPEQARGLPLDTRADIWAFGVVLYEMLVGRRPFDGPTLQDVVVAVLTADPDWNALPPTVPQSVARLLHRCLERDPGRRLRTIAAARYLLEDARATGHGSPAPPTAPSRPRRWLLLGAMAAGAAIMFAVYDVVARTRSAAVPPDPGVILGMSDPGGEPLYLFAGPIAVSPDGTRVAMVTNSAEGKPHIWLRALNTMTPELLQPADGGLNPFWSPDGRSLGFFASGHLKAIDLASRTVHDIAPWHGPIAGGAWNADGDIVFTDGGGLRRVAATGGAVSPVTSIDPGTQAGDFYAAPCFLPDQRHFIFIEGNTRGQGPTAMVGSLDSPTPTRLFEASSLAVYANPGYLLYERGGDIVAQRFNASRLSIEGDPVVLASGVWAWSYGGMSGISVSQNGLLMFATRRTATTQLTWYDRNGRPSGTVGERGEWIHLQVSPDGRAVAAEQLDPRSGLGTIWTIDLASRVPSRLTPDPVWSLAPIWSPDSTRIAFGASRGGASNLFAKRADGSGAEEPLYMSNELKVPTDWTRDGRIIFNTTAALGTDVMSVADSGDRQPVPLVNTPWTEGSGKVSPDGRLLAYISNESGRPEVYVRPMTGTGRWAVSQNGGWQPRWSRDGKELFFVSADWSLMVARVTFGTGTFSATAPEPLPIKVQPDVTGWRYSYDVDGSGQRFLVNAPASADSRLPVTAISHWTALLRR